MTSPFNENILFGSIKDGSETTLMARNRPSVTTTYSSLHRKRLFSSKQQSDSQSKPPEHGSKTLKTSKKVSENEENENVFHTDPFEFHENRNSKQGAGPKRRVLGDKTNLQQQQPKNVHSPDAIQIKKQNKSAVNVKNKGRVKHGINQSDNLSLLATTSLTHSSDMVGHLDNFSRTKSSKNIKNSLQVKKSVQGGKNKKKRRLQPRQIPSLLKRLDAPTTVPNDDMEVPFVFPEELKQLDMHNIDLIQEMDSNHSSNSDEAKTMSLSPRSGASRLTLADPSVNEAKVLLPPEMNENSNKIEDVQDDTCQDSMRLLDEYIVIPESPPLPRPVVLENNHNDEDNHCRMEIDELKGKDTKSKQFQQKTPVASVPQVEDFNTFSPLCANPPPSHHEEIAVNTPSPNPPRRKSKLLKPDEKAKMPIESTPPRKMNANDTSTSGQITPLLDPTGIDLPLTLPALPQDMNLSSSQPARRKSSTVQAAQKKPKKKSSIVGRMQRPPRDRLRQLVIPDDIDELLSESFEFVCRIGYPQKKKK